MAFIKLGAIAAFFYAIFSGKLTWILWSIILWEVGGGFKGSAVLWISDFGNDKHGSGSK